MFVCEKKREELYYLQDEKMKSSEVESGEEVQSGEI
jgi:hypothetical protein